MTGIRRLVPARLHRRRRRMSALIIPLPEAEPLVAPFRSRYDPSARGGVPAHVTVLFPFVPPEDVDGQLHDAVAEIAAAAAPFSLVLQRVGRFPDVVYLAPEPSRPFIDLTEATVRRWPEHRPYEGAYDEIVPHLTVAHGQPAGVAEALASGLPVAARAEELVLMLEKGGGRWTTSARWRLGG